MVDLKQKDSNMSIQLKSKSPRCFICDELVLNKKQHLMDKHGEFVYYHYVQMYCKFLRMTVGQLDFKYLTSLKTLDDVD